MADRDTTSGATSPKPTGPEFLDEYAGHIGQLFKASVLPLLSVAGADTITADVDPALPGSGLAAGMKFTLVWASSNTGPATLNIGGSGAVSIVDRDGGALTTGQLTAGVRDMLEFDGTNLVLISGGTDANAVVTGMTTYDVTTAWTNNLPPDTIIRVQLWGGGGGGGLTRGGGGGAYQEQFFRAGDLSGSVTITIGSGGAPNASSTAATAGGTSTFGSYLTASGGRLLSLGGGGGPSGDIVSALYSGGNGATSSVNGDSAWYGGGGGAGGAGKVGGGSQFGGAGGDYNTSGTRPGGGGSHSAGAGAPGRCIITIF